jgi:ABC-type amino acid transport substrate-binding protein
MKIIKSSFCSGGSCVEVDMESIPGTVHVFDENDNLCVFSTQEWSDFIAGVKNGEFDIKE